MILKTPRVRRRPPSPASAPSRRADPDDPGLNALIDDLRARSTSFVELWAEGQVAERRAGRKTVHHPELGRITLDCDTLHIPDVDQRLIVYSAAPGTAEDDALALLRVIGLQGINTDR